MKRVEGHNNLYRTEKGAIVNTDNSAYQAYIKRRQKSQERDQEVDSLKIQLEESKKQIEELKELVKIALKQQT